MLISLIPMFSATDVISRCFQELRGNKTSCNSWNSPQ